MRTIVRRNERSWAIVMISEIRLMLKSMDLKIKGVGGESTLSIGMKRMFPDLLLYADEEQTKILQGWELKMPDVSITDEALIQDAERKANVLGLSSFIIWNFTYGKLYIKNEDGEFLETKVWAGCSHIKTREDVTTCKKEWVPIVKDIILTVNEFLTTGKIKPIPLIETVSDNLIAKIIQRNKNITADKLYNEIKKNMQMECDLQVWWNEFREEFAQDERNAHSAYAKSILLNWLNRITFANTIKRYLNYARMIEQIDLTTTPADANAIIDQMIEKGDFYHIFKKIDYNELIPEDTWLDIVDYNRFLIENNIEKIDQNALQQLLETTVNVAKREIRGQYATPYCLADLLTQITISNWESECADLCAGTGTIAKAIIQNKSERLGSSEDAFRTTWLSDKYAYPLQIANIAVTNMDALNIPLNLFQADVFEIQSGDSVEIKNPADGTKIERRIPKFGAIVSNLPFVSYNKIAADEIQHIADCAKKLENATGIGFTPGKTDLYNYLPFKLYELLDANGRLGIVVSNSWLGTEVGKKFFDALRYYYKISAVVISDCGRWFQNADVVAALLVLQKKEIQKPKETEEICFWLLHKELASLPKEEMRSMVGSIVLQKELNASVASVHRYSNEAIEKAYNLGVTLNTLFHDISWLEKIKDCLIPIGTVFIIKRGERRGWNELFYPSEWDNIEAEYIRPVLKNPAALKSYTAQSDIRAFCCHKSKSELKQLKHFGALKWIEKFENIQNDAGKPLPEALKRSGCYWYEMDDSTKADFVTALNPDKRLFVAMFDERTFVDQRFTRMLVKESFDKSKALLHALLNSLYGVFAIEAIGFGRGLGVLDASSNRLKRMYMLDPQKISPEDEEEILALFDKIKKRDVMDIADELKDPDREKFDRKVLQAIGHEDLYDTIKKSLLSLQHTRHAVKNNETRK